MTHAERINVAVNETVEAVEIVNGAASALNDLVLNHQPSLISDTTIVKEAAELLLHAVQNVRRSATAALESKPSTKEARRDS